MNIGKAIRRLFHKVDPAEWAAGLLERRLAGKSVIPDAVEINNILVVKNEHGVWELGGVFRRRAPKEDENA